MALYDVGVYQLIALEARSYSRNTHLLPGFSRNLQPYSLCHNIYTRPCPVSKDRSHTHKSTTNTSQPHQPTTTRLSKSNHQPRNNRSATPTKKPRSAITPIASPKTVPSARPRPRSSSRSTTPTTRSPTPAAARSTTSAVTASSGALAGSSKTTLATTRLKRCHDLKPVLAAVSRGRRLGSEGRRRRTRTRISSVMSSLAACSRR